MSESWSSIQLRGVHRLNFSMSSQGTGPCNQRGTTPSDLCSAPATDVRSFKLHEAWKCMDRTLQRSTAMCHTSVQTEKRISRPALKHRRAHNVFAFVVLLTLCGFRRPHCCHGCRVGLVSRIILVQTPAPRPQQAIKASLGALGVYVWRLWLIVPPGGPASSRDSSHLAVKCLPMIHLAMKEQALQLNSKSNGIQ
jgi:hypothetical protein